MDILLINPNSRKKDYVEHPPLITPPINLMYIAQSLVNNNYNVKILDCFANNLSDNELLDIIKKKKPNMIGIPLYSSDLTMVYYLTKKIKKYDPKIKIFVAGHHASVLYEQVMNQFPNIDFIIRGEGEFTTVKLIKQIEKNNDLKKIRGVSFRKNKKIVHNKDSKYIKNLDKIPIPSRKLIDKNLYYSKMSKRDNVDVLITSRGCPYSCTFCAKLTKSFKKYRFRSIDNIIEELKIIKDSGTNGIEIYDEIFTLKEKRVKEFIRAIKKENLDFEFRIRTRVNHVNKNMLSGLKKIGCSTISYGVESGSQQILDNIKKGTTISMIKKAFSITDKENINILGFFMIGNRGDTPNTINKTINFAKKLNPLFATFGVLRPYPGTVDYNLAVLNKTLVGEYAPNKALPWIKLPWINNISELYKYSEKAYDEYYKRPKYMSKFLISTIKQQNWNLIKYTVKNFHKKLSRINAI